MTMNQKYQLALNTFIKLQRCANSTVGDIHNDAESSLTISQFGVLEALLHLGPLCQKELAGKILKSPGNITTVINNLEKRHLVTREVHPIDRRSYIVHLTTKGNQLISRIFPDHAEKIFERMSALTEKEQHRLGVLLKKLGVQKAK